MLGDDGSAFALGRHALRHALEIRDGLRRPTPLGAAVREHFGLSDALKALTHVHAGGPTVVAGLAAEVLRLAGRGDPDAARIVRDGARELARTARAVAARLGDPAAPIALGGGLLGRKLYAARVRETLVEALPGRRVFAPRAQPVRGAVRLAGEILPDV
jgi:N-acetylglucosamine kinase-like BadF-type ATPase